MNLAVTNTRTLKLVKQHSLVAFSGLCIAVAAVTGVAVGVNSNRSGGSAVEAPRIDYGTRFRTTADDWRTFYYIVATQELGDQILAAEAEQQNTILENDGRPPSRTIRVFVADSAEQESLLASMLADASPETTSFVDLRYPPIPPIVSPEAGVFSEAAPPAGIDAQPNQPYPCSERVEVLATFPPHLLLGLCN